MKVLKPNASIKRHGGRKYEKTNPSTTRVRLNGGLGSWRLHMISGTQLQQLRNDGYDDAADDIEQLRAVIKEITNYICPCKADDDCPLCRARKLLNDA